MSEVRTVPGGVQIKVKIQPRAAKNELAGWLDGMLKIRLTAPPVDGEANAACVQFLAELFAVPKSAVKIVNGQTSRHKTIEIKGVTAEYVHKLKV
ncbi:MAG: YggU family protein [Firmicutes bacterium]|nr:YggU family protein [Bacillota bacterium]